jgi:Raf kinase inhibitor-like YbhB/YbcL family protein
VINPAGYRAARAAFRSSGHFPAVGNEIRQYDALLLSVRETIRSTMTRTMTPLVVRLGFLEFPLHYRCTGADESPEIILAGLDPAAVSVALMVINPFIKTCCSFSPWLIWNLPPAPVIPSGIPKQPVVVHPVNAVQGRTDFGTIGYTGPCPGPGEMHRYAFRVWSLDAILSLPPGSGKHDLIAAMRGHVLQYGETAAIATG